MRLHLQVALTVIALVSCQEEDAGERGEPLTSVPMIRNESFAFSVVRASSGKVVYDHDLVESSFQVGITQGIPLLFHRSHWHAIANLEKAQQRNEGKSKRKSNRPPTTPEKAKLEEERIARNIASCAQLNDGSVTAYYNDSQAEDLVLLRLIPSLKLLNQEASETAELLQAAWEKMSTWPMNKLFVLKADVLRLAAVFLHGGWWLDSDVVCIDGISSTLNSPPILREISQAYETLGGRAAPEDTCSSQESCGGTAGATPAFSIEANHACLFAWEGELPAPPSCPLQWAFGCPRSHPFLLLALRLLARRVLDFTPRPAKERPDGFAALVEKDVKQKADRINGAVFVPVLELTGPGLVCAALEEYAGLGRPAAPTWMTRADGDVGGDAERGRDGGEEWRLEQVRQTFGETPSDKGSWARVSVVVGSQPQQSERASAEGAERSRWDVVLLPYCFFRSRGCSHLLGPYNDSVIFHHEFDTNWRRTFFHNYYTEP